MPSRFLPCRWRESNDRRSRDDSRGAQVSNVSFGSTSAVSRFLRHGCFTPVNSTDQRTPLKSFCMEGVKCRRHAHCSSAKYKAEPWERWKNEQSVSAISWGLERRKQDRRPADRGSSWRKLALVLCRRAVGGAPSLRKRETETSGVGGLVGRYVERRRVLYGCHRR